MNKAFIQQMRIKSMTDKYSKEHPEFTKKEVMRHVVLTICGEEGVKKFDELVGKPKECKKIIKGKDFSKELKQISELANIDGIEKDIDEIPDEAIENDTNSEQVSKESDNRTVPETDSASKPSHSKSKKHSKKKKKKKKK